MDWKEEVELAMSEKIWKVLGAIILALIIGGLWWMLDYYSWFTNEEVIFHGSGPMTVGTLVDRIQGGQSDKKTSDIPCTLYNPRSVEPSRGFPTQKSCVLRQELERAS